VSKAMLNAATRALARELGPAARVNAVCPGWVRTDMGGAAAPRDLAEGAASILWGLSVAPDGPTGGFFRDGAPIAF
ncbi:MAG: SDR family oxidoreductase, partial [Myxococcales bacterium]|nr:SDR family oxidoreductase [Myxococcales bacterium]